MDFECFEYEEIPELRWHSTSFGDDPQNEDFAEVDETEDEESIDLSQLSDTLKFVLDRVQSIYGCGMDLKTLEHWVDDTFDEISGGTEEDYQLLKDFASTELGITVIEADLRNEAHGIQNSFTSKITIDSKLDTSKRIYVLSHELGHALFAPDPGEYLKKLTFVEEVEAESVSMVMCKHLGVDCMPSAELYINYWLKYGRYPPDEVLPLLDEDIVSATDRIKQGLDRLNSSSRMDVDPTFIDNE